MNSIPGRATFKNFFFATVIILCVLALQWLLRDYIGAVQILFVYPALFAIAWLCGFWPSLFAMVVSLVGIDFFFVEPGRHLGMGKPEEFFRVVALIGTTTLMSWLMDRRRTSESALNESNQNFKFLSDTIAQLVWVTDIHGHPEYINERWYAYTGQSKDEPPTREGWLKVTHPEDRETVLREHLEAVKAKLDFVVEYRIRRYDGEYRWHLARTVFVKDKRGKITKRFGTATDIHDQKILEKKLESAVKARDEFLSLASHELKTPLTSLQLQVQLRQRDVQREGLNTALMEKIYKGLQSEHGMVKRIARLIDDMLDVSRINAGKLNLQKENFDLNQMVQDVITQFKPTAETTGVTVEFSGRYSEAIPGEWDRFRIEQVLLNLLTNALRYGETKPISVKTDRIGSSAVFSVTDEGMGIASENQDKIFSRFERIVSAGTISGMGLGLYISRQIVEAHGGRIEVQSRPGSGSTFTVFLPR